MSEYIRWIKESVGWLVDDFFVTMVLLVSMMMLTIVLIPFVPFIKLYRWTKK